MASREINGAHQNPSEAVRADARLVKADAAKLARFKCAIREGLDDVEAGRMIEVGDLGAYFDEIEAEILGKIAKSADE